MCTSLLSLEKQVSSNQPHWPPCWHRYIHKACQNGIFHTLTTAFFYTGLLSWQSHLIPDLLQCGWFSSWRPLPDVSSLQMNVLPFGVVWFGPDLSKWVSPLWHHGAGLRRSSCASVHVPVLVVMSKIHSWAKKSSSETFPPLSFQTSHRSSVLLRCSVWGATSLHPSGFCRAWALCLPVDLVNHHKFGVL